MNARSPSTELLQTACSAALRSDWIERIWLRLGAMYGRKWADAYPTSGQAERQILLDEWAQELAGYSGIEIKRGLSSCKTQCPDWPPTLIKFQAMCRPALDPETAWTEASHGAWARKQGEFGKWTSRATYYAYEEFGAHDLMHKSFAVCKARWIEILRVCEAADREGALGPIPQPAVHLPAPGQAVTNIEQGRKNIQEVALALVASAKPSASYCSDGRDWARRILANPKRHAFASVKMARAALPDWQPPALGQDYENLNERQTEG